MKKAIDHGYRHFDTAFLYNNEYEVGEAIREKISEGIIAREDVFVSTKVCAPAFVVSIQWNIWTCVNRWFLRSFGVLSMSRNALSMHAGNLCKT